jgi:hypothetical protein
MSSDVMSRAESLGCPRHQSALYKCWTKTRNRIASKSNFAVHVPLALQTNCKSFKRATLHSSLTQHWQGPRVKHTLGFAWISGFSDRLQPSETLEPCRRTCYYALLQRKNKTCARLQGHTVRTRQKSTNTVRTRQKSKAYTLL